VYLKRLRNTMYLIYNTQPSLPGEIQAGDIPNINRSADCYIASFRTVLLLHQELHPVECIAGSTLFFGFLTVTVTL